MTKLLEEGDNYRVELDGEVAQCRVWSRPDLDFSAGARLAEQKVAICRSLAQGGARGMLFDLREAPKVTGPNTQAALALIIGAWEAAARPLAIVLSPASLQMLQLTRLARDAAPQHAEVFVDFELARQRLAQRMLERQTASLIVHVGNVSTAAADASPRTSLAAAKGASLRAGKRQP